MHTSLVTLWHQRINVILTLLLGASIFFTGGTDVHAQATVTRPPLTRRPMIGPSDKVGQSTVKGRVVYKDNAQPLKSVRVHVFTGNDNSGDDADERPGGLPQEVVAFTNNRGEFQLEKLAAGKYYVTVEGPGISAPNGFGMRLPVPMTAIPRREDFEEIIPRHDGELTVDGTNTVQIEVAIVRGGSISGKVLRPNHAVVADVAVSFVSREGSGGGPYMARFSTQTDRDGGYRMENLPPGDYVVAAATEDKSASFDIRARMRGESQILTYHPAAISIHDASSVRVDSGRETSGVDITLVPRNTFLLSGTVVRQQDGTVFAGATVLLRNKDSELGGPLVPGQSQRTTRSDAEGHWSFTNVMEGSYVVTALVPASSASRAARVPGAAPDLQPPNREQSYRESRQRFLVAQQDVSVAGANLQGLTLAIVGPGSIRGTVAVEQGAIPADLVIFLELIREGGRPGPPLPVRVKPDGSFSVDGIQGGDVYLAAALPPGFQYFIKSLTADGDDPRRTPLKVIEGAEAGPIKIVLSADVGRLAGRVLADKSDEGLGDYVLLLAPTENHRQRFRTAYLTARTASDGTYSLSGEPGEYFIFARRREDLPPIVTEQFVRTEGPKARRVVLVSGEQKRLELRVP